MFLIILFCIAILLIFGSSFITLVHHNYSGRKTLTRTGVILYITSNIAAALIFALLGALFFKVIPDQLSVKSGWVNIWGLVISLLQILIISAHAVKKLAMQWMLTIALSANIAYIVYIYDIITKTM